MTEKRFKIVNLSDDNICDIQDTSQEILTFYNDLTYNYGSAKAICDLLNELDENFDDALNTISKIQEENQSSKEFIEQLQEELVLFKEAGANMSINLNAQITALKQENKELKQKIKELELLNDGLNYALKYIRKIDVVIDVGDL